MSMAVFFSQDPWRLLQPLTLALRAIDNQNAAAVIRIGQASDLPTLACLAPADIGQ